MAEPVKIAFEREVLVVPIAEILPSRMLPPGLERDDLRYRRIAASVARLGPVEPFPSPDKLEAAIFCWTAMFD